MPSGSFSVSLYKILRLLPLSITQFHNMYVAKVSLLLCSCKSDKFKTVKMVLAEEHQHILHKRVFMVVRLLH